MPSIPESDLPPPRNWEDFEDLCADLFEIEWKDPHTTRYGRQGQRQNGVDIYGLYNSSGHYGAQCKKKKRWPPKKLTINDIDAEVKEALKFRPKLDVFVIATTADRDTKLQDHVHSLSEKHREKGLFRVVVLFWEEITRRALRHSGLTEKHFGYVALGQIRDTLEQASKNLERLASDIQPQSIQAVDAEIERCVGLLKRYRWLEEFEGTAFAKEFACKLIEGDLRFGQPSKKSTALAWCARVLAHQDVGVSVDLLYKYPAGSASEEWQIAEAVIKAQMGGWQEGVNALSKLDTPASRSAAFFVVIKQKGAQEGFEWLERAEISYEDMDHDGRCNYLLQCMEIQDWSQAYAAASTITIQEVAQAPVLGLAAANALVAQAVDPELRSYVIQQNPFMARRFPLETTDDALRDLEKAQTLLAQLAEIFSKAGLSANANHASDRALWIQLRRPDTRASGIESLSASMNDPSHKLRRLNLALQFGLQVDLDSVSEEISRQTAQTAGESLDAAMARFAMVFAQKSEHEVIAYIDQHREQLGRFVDNQTLVSIEIEMLAKSGRVGDAESRLALLVEDGIDQVTQQRLSAIINNVGDVDPVASAQRAFADEQSLEALDRLVDVLQQKADWPQMYNYAAQFHRRVNSVESAERVVLALSNLRRFVDVVNLLLKQPEFIEQSSFLKSSWALSNFYQGKVSGPKKEIEDLRKTDDGRELRELEIEVIITSGDWEELARLVEETWTNRGGRSALELLRAAQLARSISLARSKDLVRAASLKANDDPDILIGAFGLAVQEGWESETEVQDWLERAVRHSPANGPVKKIALKQLMAEKPEWEERRSEVLRLVQSGQIPYFVAAASLGKTLGDFFLLPFMANKQEADVRRRTNLFTYSAKREPVTIDAGSVCIDASAVLTLGGLGLLDTVIEQFEKTIIPHTTIAWLFEEHQRIQFHQPSRVRDANTLRDLVHAGLLTEFVAVETGDTDLSAEVGPILASMISEAGIVNPDKSDQRVVVHPGPVHKVGSLLDQKVDLTKYSSRICGCSAVVRKLRSVGQLTARESERVLSFLSSVEDPWPDEPDLEDGANLYLDTLAVTYFNRFGVLEKLRPAGFVAHISSAESNEVQALLKYDSLASFSGQVIDGVRVSLSNGIKTGKVELGVRLSNEDGRLDDIALHPTYSLLETAKRADAIIVDDRYYNQHAYLDVEGRQVQVITSLDVLDYLFSRGTVGLEERAETRTMLRRCGCLFVPVEKDEIKQFLSESTLDGSEVFETAELRAIRESCLEIKMAGALNLPEEVPWLMRFQTVFSEVLLAQWNQNIDSHTSRARSNWLLPLLDIRGYTESFSQKSALDFVDGGRLAQLFKLLRLPEEADVETVGRYWLWLEQTLLADLKRREPNVYQQLIDEIESRLSEVSQIDFLEGQAG